MSIPFKITSQLRPVTTFTRKPSDARVTRVSDTAYEASTSTPDGPVKAQGPSEGVALQNLARAVRANLEKSTADRVMA